MEPKCSPKLSGPNYMPMQHQLWSPAACLWPFPEGGRRSDTTGGSWRGWGNLRHIGGHEPEAFQSIPWTTCVKSKSVTITRLTTSSSFKRRPKKKSTLYFFVLLFNHQQPFTLVPFRRKTQVKWKHICRVKTPWTSLPELPRRQTNHTTTIKNSFKIQCLPDTIVLRSRDFGCTHIWDKCSS